MSRREAERLLEFWRSRLAPAWQVEIDWDTPSDPGRTAEVSWSEDYEVATVRVDRDWQDRGPGPSGDPNFEAEVDLVHEVLHVCQQPVALLFRSMQEQLPPGPARQLAFDRYRHEDERQVERIARLLVALRRGHG